MGRSVHNLFLSRLPFDLILLLSLFVNLHNDVSVYVDKVDVVRISSRGRVSNACHYTIAHRRGGVARWWVRYIAHQRLLLSGISRSIKISKTPGEQGWKPAPNGLHQRLTFVCLLFWLRTTAQPWFQPAAVCVVLVIAECRKGIWGYYRYRLRQCHCAAGSSNKWMNPCDPARL